LLEEELKVERRKLQEIAERTPAEIIERSKRKSKSKINVQQHD
jgi:hypothetical protein